MQTEKFIQKQLTIVSGGRNHIRDYVAEVLKTFAADATSSDVGQIVSQAASGHRVVLSARMRAIPKAISVAEVAKKCAAERGVFLKTEAQLHGMLAEGPGRRDAPSIEIAIESVADTVSDS
eukprot:gnl/MRDRNA2_/MRDRNA2_34934_c0_seq1.p1 gnl/MRDRNA2_/MRDRNA2_34934_c0~~gnl/MRDRNA2_/MRDRNA2_34934_c0_seq1.p1  ORF type:complete len:121 (+),score=25.19 gnl/MRDRNA2_/MRDRNA2_34934_c0_seq1:69-431(+)